MTHAESHSETRTVDADWIREVVAEYETPFIVPCRSPVVLTAAEEAVRTGFMEAGKPDLFNRDNVRFLSDEQFAFTAATNGIMLREKPVANIYIGAFWAESLILAETGFLAGAIQIAGPRRRALRTCRRAPPPRDADR